MKFEMMFIGGLFFALAFVLGASLIGKNLSTYNVTGDTSSFGKMSNNLKQVYDYQNNMKTQIEGQSVSDSNAIDDMVLGGYTGIRNNPMSVMGVVSNQTMVLAKESGLVKPEIIWFFTTTLSILVLIAIIALIFKFYQR